MGMSGPASAGRLARAITAASLAACLTALLSGFVYVYKFSDGLITAASDPTFYQAGFYVGLIAMTISLLACLLLFSILGLPLYRLSLRLRWVRAWQYAVVGFGVSCFAAIGAFLTFPLDREFAVPLTMIGGTIATLAFWSVARPHIDE